MTRSDAAIILSVLSLFVSGISVGFNIYKEMMLRARLRVRVKSGFVFLGQTKVKRVIVSAVNYGPGKSRPNALTLRKRGARNWYGRRRYEYAFLIHDYEDVLSGPLPCELDVGQSMNLTFRFGPDVFFKDDYQDIGVTDSFGNTYWSGVALYAEAKQNYAEMLAEHGAAD